MNTGVGMRVQWWAGLAFLLVVAIQPALAQRGERGRHAPSPGTEALQEQRDEVVQFIQENFPEKARMLKDLRKRDPEEFQRRRQQLAEEVRHLRELRRDNPELFRLQMDEMRLRDETSRLVREARKAEGGKGRDEAVRRLREALERSFDLRTRIKQGEVEDLRRRLVDLENSLKRRGERRAQMVEERQRQLLEGGEEDW
jgi:hypothetical protein